MRVNSINSTTPKFKGTREDRNITAQLKTNNSYSLTEPNQRRISQAIENLAKQRGEENIRFLLNVGENLTYQTNIPNAKATKNDWRSRLKEATERSLAISDPILKEKYEPEIKRVFNEQKPLSEDEKKILMHRDSIMYRADLDSLKSNPNENIRNLESNMDYFISSTETPTAEKAYVMERLDYMMSPHYKINPQLKDKKTQVLAEMMNDMVINTPESKVPNIKAVNQKTHGMCAAISIARKSVAYEDKANYVDALLSELDDTTSVMVYDRHNLGSGKRVPVEKTFVDFDYAQEKGYRIIDASTLQWMGIANMYGTQNEKLNDFFAFDREHFDAFHDSFFMKNVDDSELKIKQSHFQSLVKAKDELENVKASNILKDIKRVEREQSRDKNLELIQKYNEDSKKNIKKLVPDISKSELDEDMSVIMNLYAPTSEKAAKKDIKIRQYTFLPNEETSQKEKKVQSYFADKYSDRVLDKDINKTVSYLISNIETVKGLEKSLSDTSSMSGKIANARKLYNAEATYRTSLEMGLKDNDNLTDYLIHYNIPDNESRISQGYQTVIDRIEKKNDTKLVNHFAGMFGVDPEDKESIVAHLQQIKDSVDYIQTEGLDNLYASMGVGDRRHILLSEVSAVKSAVENGDKGEMSRMAKTMNVKEDKKHVTAELTKLEESLSSDRSDEKAYKHVLNRIGSKNEMLNFIDIHKMFIEKLQNIDGTEGSVYLANFKHLNGLAQDCSAEELQQAINGVGQTFNVFAQSMANAEVILNVPNEDGSMYFTVDGSRLVMKKMENEGKLVPAKDMRALQTRFNKIDKLRSSDEFSSRQGKISDPELYKLTKPEKEAIKKIGGKVNAMYSDVVREHNRVFKSIRGTLEKQAMYVGTNTGNYWVSKDGHSGMYGAQQVKILEQLTDRPYKMVSNIDEAVDIIKNSAYSGISSTSVFSHDNGWHAQYVADVKEVGKDGRTAIFHDNTWGASEHENTWVDSEGLTRTDYSDRRGGDLGYITNDDWRNGNYVDNLTKKAGHITPHDVDSREYKKLRPAGEEYDFSTISDIIVSGKNPEYKDIAAQIKDSIFVPDSVFLPDITKHANEMTSREIQKAIFRNESAGSTYHAKFEKLQRRVKGDMLKKGITTLEDYNKLSDNDPVKITFEKAAIRLAYPDASMYKELGQALDMESVMKVKAEQKQIATDNFDYAFGKSPDVMFYLAQKQSKNIANIVINSLQNNGLPIEKAADIVKNIVVLDKDEKAQFTGSTEDTIELVLDKLSRQYDENVDTTLSSKKAKSEMMTGMRNLLSEALYFNKDDMSFESPKAKGIENWVDEKFNPATDEEFIHIYNTLQDMKTEDFVKLREGVTEKQLGMSGITGFDVLQKFNAANDEAESTVKNILFYEEYTKDMTQSKTKTTYKFSKLNKKNRGAIYVGQRTFDDLYRSMQFSLSTLTYDKMFNKWKDANFRKHGAFPAYPKLDLSNNKSIKAEVDSLYEKVGESMSEIIQKKNIQRDYAIIDELGNYTNQLNPEKTPTGPQIKHAQNLAGEFITLNMNDSSIADSLNAAYKILDMKRGVGYDELKSNVDIMVKEFGIIKQANSGFDIGSYLKTQKEFLDKYTDTIIDISIPPRYQKKVKESALKWQALELKYAVGAKVDSNNMQLLQSKIDKASVSPKSEKQINSFEKIEELVAKTKKLKSAKNLDKAKIQENEAMIAEMTEKYVNRYIKEDSRENIKANISDWSRKQLHGGNRRQVTEDDVIDARDKFENDFYKYHITKNPVDLLNTYLLLSSKDAKEKYPKSVENVKIYERMLSDELSLTRFVEIQDALMEAVQTGNTAHVKEYFDEYHIGANEQISMNSDEAIDYMVKYMLMDDNTKPAKMFVEKLGLGDRVMEIETKGIHEEKPRKQVDKLVNVIKSINAFQKAITEEYSALMSTVDTVEDADDAIETAKQNILKKLQGKKVSKTLVKAYMDAMDAAKKSLKENPEMQRSLMIGSIHSSVAQQIQEHINDELQEKQGKLSALHIIYKFLLGLKLPEYSDGYKQQQQLAKEYADLLRYNNEQLKAVSAGSDAIAIKSVDN